MELRNRKQVKVQGKFRASRCAWDRNRHKIVPWLTISGVWLERLGFNVGGRVNIISTNKRIIIEIAEDGHEQVELE
ncbi:MAG TPA: SymE family type I addiction module toxin [Arachidicoccus sp.]|nr:SymE family type I addiction module toxin [Arachidicoccus sp.]